MDSPVLLWGVGLYLVAMFAIGIAAAKRSHSSEDFMIAGRRLPLWLATATLIATWFGAGTVMGASGAAYGGGLLAVIADPFGGILCFFLSALLVIRTLRRMRLVTIVDFFETRFSTEAGLFASAGMVIAYVGWTGAQLVAFGYILNLLTGLDTTTGMLVATAVVLVYTVVGGMWAVALTDFAQILIVLLGLVVLFVVVVSDMGGLAAALAQVPDGYLRLTPEHTSWESWLPYMRDWVILGVGSIAAPDVLQRSFSSRSETVAQDSAYLAGVGYLTVGLIPVFLGMFAVSLLPGLDTPEKAIPLLAIEHLHPALLAIFVGALLAAIMSSADSAMLAPASIIANNIVPYFSGPLSDRAKLLWVRASVLMVGLGGLYIAWKVQSVYNLMLDALSIMLVALVVPVVLGIWWRKANNLSALLSMTAGSAVWIVGLLLFPDYSPDFIGFGVAIVVMLVSVPLTQRADPPRPLLGVDGNTVDAHNKLGLPWQRGYPAARN